MNELPLIVLGGGGHAKVIIDTALNLGIKILGLTDEDVTKHGKKILGVSILGNDAWVKKNCSPDQVCLISGHGDIRLSQRLYEYFSAQGFNFVTLLHPSAVIGREVKIADGTAIMAGVIIQPSVNIGANVIVNTGAKIDHDSTIGSHTHIAPGAVLSGGAQIGESTMVGCGTHIIESIKIGNKVTIAAGAVVISNIGNNKKVRGIPAEEWKN
jgi:UDP-perosamine 4-acetyltransferase